MIIDDAASIERLLRATKRIAVLGIKTEAQSSQAAFYVAKFLADAGYDLVPVPVYYPDVTTILGRPVFRKLVDVPGELDMVDVFRRPQDLDDHLDDILAKKPKSVWLQVGMYAFAKKLSDSGITVVQDRCLMIEMQMRGLSNTG